MSRQPRSRPPRLVPPSVVGGCLRYAVMEVLRFGRAVSDAAMAAMSEGAAWHRRFQATAHTAGYRVVAVERPFRNLEAGVAGRIDAIVEIEAEPAVLEYKTVQGGLFGELASSRRPLVAHWAQLMVYLLFTDYRQGLLVVDSREDGARLSWRVRRGEVLPWEAWVKERVAAIRRHAEARRLPPREVSQGCLFCDRWQRCFGSEEERAEAVRAHPQWTPDPPLPEAAPALWPDAIA